LENLRIEGNYLENVTKELKEVEFLKEYKSFAKLHDEKVAEHIHELV